MRIDRLLLSAALCLFLGACSWSNFPFLYKPNVQQGNDITEAQLAQVHPGMNRNEVNYLLGNPVLTNVIDTQDVQYVYTMKEGKKSMTEKKVQLLFVNDKLKSIT